MGKYKETQEHKQQLVLVASSTTAAEGGQLGNFSPRGGREGSCE